jgi:serine/threonine-protein kinase
MDTDRNLLFGVLALQADLIDNDRFARGCALWAADKGRPLAEVLVEQDWLSPGDRADVEKLLQRKLAKHGGDARAGLAELTTDQVRQSLAGLDDADVRKSLLTATPPTVGRVLLTTTAYVPEVRERYTLSRVHASGGLGRVWLARDDSLGRDVALKELRPERAGHPAVAARFLKEAKITGQLEHPGIVPVYELARRPGDEQPFYTMRFVRGRTLAEAARAYHERRQRGETGPLELRELLTAFVGVCNAVAYAHSRGVIHRDLKPQNVVLGDFGEVIVLDWGLAKVLGEPEGGDGAPAPVALAKEDSHDQTVAGQALGTPAYMAPEQAEGRLDLLSPATDVYGLGAILYEILTGQPPFAGADTESVLRRVTHDPPQRPRAVVLSAPAALEAVCLKALAKKPAERYAKALELADEVRHWLADEPVAAYREPLTARAGRWVRRHRTLTAAGAVGLLAAVAGLAAVLAVQSRAKAELAAKNRELEAANERERQRFDLAMEAVGAFHTGVSEDVLLKQQEFEPLRKKLLNTAADFYRKLQAQLGDAADPRSQAALAKAYVGLGGAAAAVGSTEQALKDFDRARELYEALAASDPDDLSHRRALSRVLTDIARVREQRQETDLMRKATGRAVAVAEELTAVAPADPEDVNLLARALIGLGRTYAGSLDEQERQYRRAADLAERLVAEHPGVPEYRNCLASALGNLASVAWYKSRYEECAQLSARASESGEAARQQDPGNAKYRMQLAAFCDGTARALGQMGRLDDSLSAFRRSAQLLEELTAEQPAVIEYQRRLSNAYQNTGWALGQLGRTEEAGDAVRRQVAVLDTLVSRHPDRPDLREALAHALLNTGIMQAKIGRYDEGLATYQRATEILEALVKAYPANRGYRSTLASVLGARAWLLRSTGRTAEATTAYEQARDACEALVQSRPTDVQARGKLVESWQALGWHVGRTGRVADGLAALGRARELAERLAAEQPALAEHRDRLYRIESDTAFVLQDAGDEASARVAFQRALAIAEQLATDYPQFAEYRLNVGRMLSAIGLSHQRVGRLAEAREALERCLRVWEQVVAETPKVPEHRDNLGRALANLGYLESLAGESARALPLHQRAVALRERVVAEAPNNTDFQRGLGYSFTYLGQTYRRLGKPAEAGQALERALALAEALLKLKTVVAPVQELQLETRLELGMLRLVEGRPEEAARHFARAIKAAADRSDPSVDELVRLAGVHAQFSRLPDPVVADALAGTADATAGAKAHADRATALLSRAAEKGFGDVLLLTRSDAYDPLRDRDDFRALVKRLQEKTKPAGK